MRLKEKQIRAVGGRITELLGEGSRVLGEDGQERFRTGEESVRLLAVAAINAAGLELSGPRDVREALAEIMLVCRETGTDFHAEVEAAKELAALEPVPEGA